MPAPKTPKRLLRETLAHVERHGGVAQAARALNVPYTTLQARHRAAVAELGQGTIDGDEPDRSAIPVGQPFERAWTEWQAHIGMAKDRYVGPAKPRATKGRLRVVAAGDFHVPFHDRDAVADLIAKEGPHTDVLLIGGDFGDAHCASTFTKYEHVSFEEEHAAKTLVLQELSQAFPVIRYLQGSNHPDRFEKRLREHLDRDLLAAIASMTGGTLNPDLALAKRYPNVEVAGWTTPKGLPVSWLTLIGDVAFCHAEKYSRVPGATLRSIEDWLDDFAGTLGLPKLRAVVQFHTHAMALMPWRSDMLLIEPGCLCQVHQYQLGSKLGGRPQRRGYVTMDFVDGALDASSVRLRWLDAER